MNRAALLALPHDDLIALILAQQAEIEAQAQQIAGVDRVRRRKASQARPPAQDAGQFQPAALEGPEAEPA